jgi:serine/arginine repetitive matrix protein 2
VEKASITSSTTSHQFGGERMIKAQRGLLERQSLEDNRLSADGEEMASACEFVFCLRLTKTHTNLLF